VLNLKVSQKFFYINDRQTHINHKKDSLIRCKMKEIEIEAKKEFTLVKERSNPKATWIFPRMQLNKRNIRNIIMQVLNVKAIATITRIKK